MYSKPFKFKLEKILQMKIEEEEEQKRIFSKAQKKLIEEEIKLENMKKNLELKTQEYKLKLMQVGQPEYFQNFSKYLEKLKKDIELQKIVVEQAKIQLEIEKQKLQEKINERKTFEKLKEKEYNKYLQEQKMAESKFLDELSNIKFTRNKKQDV
ncbi:MAG: flagellar export protein FliJ [Candidatus Calescibacterium sp.]|nr:flagellar export protein FliJ [Candidatus Calescibacterium sp.]MCX7972126.1 flagellar export protein FliJ [bacterium]MDW8194814.1 flagellar export protein FliJ [Candidatus Calescibacterium sp.]